MADDGSRTRVSAGISTGRTALHDSNHHARGHPLGTEYAAYVMHKDKADRDIHEEMGFYDGWGTVTEQLAHLAEQRTQ